MYNAAHSTLNNSKQSNLFQTKKETWTWINGETLTESNLTREREYLDNEIANNVTQGSCGSIALNREHHIIMKSVPCLSTNMRFVCEYSKLHMYTRF